ncbi:MAG: sugar ABC transporter substrate-binding protein [Deltaproteobacteria bacterium]|nr:sugar ABC transporter substrate-binding protein [Deltaproteobacteria bacterium]
MGKINLRRLPILLLLAVLTFCFCFATPVLAKQKVVGVANQWLGNDWNFIANKAIIDYFEAKGYKVISTNAQGATNQQKADVENFIQMKVDGIIIKGGEGGAFVDVSKKAWDANIPLIGQQMFLPGAVCTVMSDSWEGNVNMGVWMVNQMHGEGKYIILDAAGWHSLVVRRDSAELVLKNFPKIKRIADVYEVDTADAINNSYDIVKATLRSHPDLKGVLCTWGQPAVGAIKAIKDMKKEKQVVVVCTDADRPVLAEMAKPDAPRTALLGLVPKDQGEYAAEVLEKAMKFKTVREAKAALPTLHLVPSHLITNTGTSKSFKQKVLLELDDAWVFFHKGKRRPW